MMEMVPSWALATQSSLRSGEMSKPSDPRPTGIDGELPVGAGRWRRRA